MQEEDNDSDVKSELSFCAKLEKRTGVKIPTMEELQVLINKRLEECKKEHPERFIFDNIDVQESADPLTVPDNAG